MILKIFLSFAIIYESIEILVTFLVIKQSETKEELADCFNNVDQLKEDDNLIISIIGRIISFFSICNCYCTLYYLFSCFIRYLGHDFILRIF